jgi:hypothetical protein
MKPHTINGKNKHVPERMKKFLELIESDVQTNEGLSNTPWCQFGGSEPIEITTKGVARLYKKYDSGRTQSFLINRQYANDWDAIMTFISSGIDAGAEGIAYAVEMFVAGDTPTELVEVIMADWIAEWRAIGFLDQKEITEWELEETDHFRPHIVTRLALDGQVPILTEDEQLDLCKFELQQQAGQRGVKVPQDVLNQLAKDMHAQLLDESTTVRLSEGQQARLQKFHRTGRNAPCPCGSGKKFKHCCLRGS